MEITFISLETIYFFILNNYWSSFIFCCIVFFLILFTVDRMYWYIKTFKMVLNL